MPFAQPPSQRIKQLAERVTNGTHTDDDIRELEEAIADDPAARNFYFDYCHLHADLQLLIKADQATVRVREATEVGGPPSTTDHRSPITHYSTPHVSRSRRNLTFGLVAGFAAVAAVLTWAAFTYLPDMAKNNDKPAADQDKVIAWLVNTHNVEWAEGGVPESTRYKPGTRLALDKGFVEIHYATGAEVVVEGPAEFVVGQSGKRKAESGQTVHPSSFILHPSNSGFLHLGRLVARCHTPGSQGFTIVAPTSRIIDVGTEFGVDVDQEGLTQVAVLDGKIDLETQMPGETLPRKQRLLAGEAVQVTSGATGNVTVKRVAADSISFTTSVPKSAYDQWTEARTELLSDVIVDMSMEGDPPANAGAIEPTVDRFGRAGGAWRFGTKGLAGPYASVSLGPSNRLMPSGDQPIAIVAWVKPEQFLPATTENRIVTLYRSYKTTGLTLAMGAAEGGKGRLSAGYVFGERLFEVAGRQRIAAAKWHHVALTFDGEVLSIYLNGALERSVNAELAASASTAATVGAFERTRHGFIGAIDDVLVLNRAVSAEQIIKLYESGRASDAGPSWSPHVSSPQENER
ncbi:MAG: hypothetical protein MI757_14295 [Pirellulales bacterium]|nr:hypothetical protein [Pirellulales bacterium]